MTNPKSTNKKNNAEKKAHTIETFFGKPYIIIFAVIIFACAAVKLAFTLSRSSVGGFLKFVLIFDTLTTLLTSSSLFLFYMSSDTKSKDGTKISGITFLVAASMSVLTQATVLIYIGTMSNFLITVLTSLFFFVPTLFMLRFAIYLSQDIFKGTLRGKGTFSFAAAKVFSLVCAMLIRFVDPSGLTRALDSTVLVDFSLYKTPFVVSNAINTNYPTLAFICIILSSLSLAAFALLYHKFATNKETSDTTEK